MEAGLLSKLPNKTLVMSNKNQFPFSFTCLAAKLFLLWMTSRRSGPLNIVWVFLSSPEAVKSLCSQEKYACSWAFVVWWCGGVAQTERGRLLRQSNCSLLPLLPILTQPACIKTPAVHCAGDWGVPSFQFGLYMWDIMIPIHTHAGGADHWVKCLTENIHR